MRKFDVQIALEGIREAQGKWQKAVLTFNSDVDYAITRLLHEAAVNYMSVDQVAHASGMTAKRVRLLMRKAGLDPKSGKRLLAKQAAEALAENSALLGIEPHEMDLTSPLAYLPMGSELKQQLLDARVARVTELPGEETETSLVVALRVVLATADDLIDHSAVITSDFEGLVLKLHELVGDHEGDNTAEFYEEHYSDWTVHALPLVVYVPTKDGSREDALALVQEILDDASFDIRVSVSGNVGCSRCGESVWCGNCGEEV